MKNLIVAAMLSAAFAVSNAQNTTFRLSSPDLKSGSSIGNDFVFNGFGCTGKNISPALAWQNAPSNTKSFAIIVHDPDAVTGVGGFTHWIVYNIPSSTAKLERGAVLATATQAITSFGTTGWSGPCPPAGEKPHRYQFSVYALNTPKLDLPSNASQAFVGFNINAAAIAKTSFTAVYGR